MDARDCEKAANDLKVFFKGKGVVQFTRDGVPIDGKFESPPGANDFKVIWDPLTGQIKEFIWTKNSNPIGNVPVPQGANDLHFKAGRIVKIIWTLDSKPLREVMAPKKANDLEFKLS